MTINYSWKQFEEDCVFLARTIDGGKYHSIYGIPRGGLPMSIRLSSLLSLPQVKFDEITQRTLIVDDIVDSGKTRSRFPGNDFACIHVKQKTKDAVNYYMDVVEEWVVYPWEEREETQPVEAIIRLIEYIGEDIYREGLKDTPTRVLRAYSELFAGYKQQNPDSFFTVFETGGYDQIILLKDIELYSMCEHHMLPFFGRAHVAYIPGEKIIGVSKLARIVEYYARRLQVQERIGKQVTQLLCEKLKPIASACIIEAEHLCMRMRGVGKQNSVMVTSSLTGDFLHNKSAREELMALVNKR